MSDLLVECDNLVKIYCTANLEVVALQGLDLRVETGEMLAIVGASGSGKSTLMNILGGLDAPTAGRSVVAGHDLFRLGEKQRLAYRRSVIGHVWQQSARNLISEYTVARNIELPQVAIRTPLATRKRRTQELLQAVDLAHLGDHYPHSLSGGEQQRASIAVALANHPRILLADEPTGELDSGTAAQIVELLRSLNAAYGLTLILVTHDPVVAAQMDRIVAIRDGRTSSEILRRSVATALATSRPTSRASASAVIGVSSLTHREVVVVDRVGRLQLPRELAERLRFSSRAEVRDAGDHIEIWPLHGNGEDEREP